MKKQLGLTLIEVCILLAIVGIVCSIGLSFVHGGKTGSTLSFGATGLTEMRCIDGYKFVVGVGGQARQVMNSAGHGVPCN